MWYFCIGWYHMYTECICKYFHTYIYTQYMYVCLYIHMYTLKPLYSSEIETLQINSARVKEKSKVTVIWWLHVASHIEVDTLPKTNNWWLEDDPFLLGPGQFSGLIFCEDIHFCGLLPSMFGEMYRWPQELLEAFKNATFNVAAGGGANPAGKKTPGPSWTNPQKTESWMKRVHPWTSLSAQSW